MNIKVIIFIVLILLLSGCVFKNVFKNYKPDNPAEEFVEKVIEDKTGLDIDLTPASKE